MAERYKSIFVNILSLAIVCLFILLFFLPQDYNTVEHWGPSQLYRNSPELRQKRFDSKGVELRRRSHEFTDQFPKPIDFVKQFQVTMSKNELLFYQFDANYKEPVANTSIGKNLHDKITRKLGAITEPKDQYVNSEGFKLFAFNLLASNRIGLIRPLPDTRHKKCSASVPLINHLQLAANITHHDTSTHSDTQEPSIIILKASIIICYYNEAPSALLRTIHTILKRSPSHLIREIIVVDDFSSDEYSQNIIKPLITSDLVNFVRTTKREGLIRARLFGANLAKGDVLIFLDSHVEANLGWLEPLLSVIKENRTTIACPMIDLINAETLIYSASPMVKGGLNWALNFKWDSVPSEDLKSYDDFVKPIESPTMAGGLYAIERDFFNQIGTYDHGMDLWGGENVELSLRTWMCGGRILILPCSRLGHIFRKKRPYGPEPNQPDSLLMNSHRAARVWLDEYIEKFYKANPDAKYLISGDINQRLDLKHKLGCHNFSWFLDNIYPSLRSQKLEANPNLIESKSKPKLFKFNTKSNRFDRETNRRHGRGLSFKTGKDILSKSSQPQIPDQIHDLSHQKWFDGNKFSHSKFISTNEKILHSEKNIDRSQRISSLPRKVSQFQIESMGSNLCIESRNGFLAKSFTRLVLNSCASIERDVNGEILINGSSIMNQLWTETELHDYRLGDNQCLDLIKYLPLLRKCHHMGSFQSWTHDEFHTTGTIITNSGGGLCLSVERVLVGEPIIVTICDRKIVKTGEIKEFSDIAQANHFPARIGWRTGSSILRSSGKYRETFGLEPLRPCQSWNLRFVVGHNSTTSGATSHFGND